jgi:transcriptional regulator with XRE-family HTH domain
MNTDHIAEIRSRLVLARKRVGLSQTQAAKLADLRFAYVLEEYEMGQGDLRLSYFLKLCDVYGVSPTWALTGINPDFDIPVPDDNCPVCGIPTDWLMCNYCDGTGKIDGHECFNCDGDGGVHLCQAHGYILFTPEDWRRLTKTPDGGLDKE